MEDLTKKAGWQVTDSNTTFNFRKSKIQIRQPVVKVEHPDLKLDFQCNPYYAVYFALVQVQQ